ncbi:Cyclomaltodextrinase [Cellulophaga algicola DSM 14237]|uniref:Cyclomaltodextrinase n=1 Tax=Cellulophaga algicola (strain DSM 14237 / IC166 / ACAM 630) TaxID=688270 RepID=E6X9Q2_CELAD|nr:glycoside hydrolase family 13 protein [Cellulophaga algicola]ADV49822.1 Cyclomaltodextrinase [Cellulophaga algicola DSM 14237]
MLRFTLFLFTFFVVTSQSLYSQNRIERMEPPNWWVGMVSEDLEIMVYGKNIGLCEIRLEKYDGVVLKEVKKVQNSNYVFISLTIAPQTVPGNLVFTLNSEKEAQVDFTYPLLKREGNKQHTVGFSSADMVYLITPDRFANGNTSNDNVNGFADKVNRKDKGGRHGGDIQGIINHLGYLSDMGFTSLWINPTLENAMPKNSYHGYAITDFYKVDPRFGSNELYKVMVKKAKEKGLTVIMDMVANHIGLKHWWMKDLPSQDWINQWPEYTETNHRKSIILDPYAAAVDRKTFFDGWFVPTMPDLNQKNQELATYLIQNAIWWIEYSGISGIRMDTYPYPDMEFMNDWSKAISEEYPLFTIVGEEWSTNPNQVAYWQQGKKNYNNYESHLKSVMDFPLQSALVNSLNSEKTWASSWIELYETLAQDYVYADPNQLMIFSDNHDMSRMYTQLNEDFDLYKLALVYLATTRGIPQLYYGTEILMTNPGTDDHGIIRSDFPGGWENDAISAFTGLGLSLKQKEAQEFVKKLLNWRKGAAVVHDGALKHFAPKNKEEVYVLFRYNDQKKIMVVLNKNTKSVRVDLSTYKEVLGEELIGTDILSDVKIKEASELTIKARSAMIIAVE